MKKEKNIKEQKMQLDVNCTFKPKIKTLSGAKTPPQVKGIEHVIERLQTARVEKEILLKISERGYNLQGAKTWRMIRNKDLQALEEDQKLFQGSLHKDSLEKSSRSNKHTTL